MNLKAIKQYRAKRVAQYQHFQNYQQDVLSEAEKSARISRAEKDYNYFCETYFAHLMSPKGKLIPNAPFHLEAAKYIKAKSNAQALFEWARGHAKSTHISLLIPLWLKTQGAFKVMVLVSKSRNMALRLLRSTHFGNTFLNIFPFHRLFFVPPPLTKRKCAIIGLRCLFEAF